MHGGSGRVRLDVSPGDSTVVESGDRSRKKSQQNLNLHSSSTLPRHECTSRHNKIMHILTEYLKVIFLVDNIKEHLRDN